MDGPSSILRGPAARSFTSEEEDQKRAMYERMNPRRRKFVDKIGYEAWDPFAAPKEPMDIRMDVTKRTTQQLVREFLQSSKREHSNEYARGVLECALGMVNREEKYLGIFDFCLWYQELVSRSLNK